MLFCTLCYSAHCAILHTVPCCTRVFTCAWVCIAFSYCNYSEPHSQNRICDAYLENRLTCSLLIEAASPLALNSYKKPRIQIHPIGTNFISAVPPKFLMWKMKTSWSYLYIHDKTLNSRNEWGNVIPYQIFHSSGMRLAWEFRFCLNLRKLFSRWTSLSVRKKESYCARSLPLLWYDNTGIAEMSRSFHHLACLYFFP